MMKKVFRNGLILFLTLFLLCRAEPAVAAWQKLSGSEILLRAEEEISGDLWVTGGVVEIRGRIKGDLLIFAEELILKGTVDGDVLGLIGRATVSGKIAGNFRGLVVDNRIEGVVSGSLSTAGSQLALGDQSRVGSLLARYTIVQLLGEIAERADVNGNHVYVDGKLDSDLQVTARQIILGNNALVGGDLVYREGTTPVFKPGAKVGGECRPVATAASSAWLGLRGVWFVGSLFCGVVWLLLFRRRWHQILEIRVPWRRLIGLGVGSLTLLPVLSVLTGLTLFGLPLSIGLLLLFLVLLVFGELPAYLLVGRWFCGLIRRNKSIHPVLSLLAGGFVLAFLKLLPVVGVFFAIAGRIVGNGLFLIYLFWRGNTGQTTVSVGASGNSFG
jgi:cytoskeletal protein CcmA (bactofilin family)